MMTFKDLKKLVELPSYKEQRVPTVKALEVSGVPVVTEKVLENHGSIENERRSQNRRKRAAPEMCQPAFLLESQIFIKSAVWRK